MITQATAGEAMQPFGGKAGQYNEMAEVVNHFTEHGLPKLGGGESGLPDCIVGFPPDATEYKQYQVVAVGPAMSEPTTTDGELDQTCPWAKHYHFQLEAIDQSKAQTYGIVQGTLMMGKAYVVLLSGLSRIKINITDANHQYAKLPDAADGTSLESATSGGFKIVSQPKDADSGEALTGEQYCTVQFPVSQGFTTIYVMCNIGGRTHDNAWTYGDSVKVGDNYGYIRSVNVTARTVEVEHYELDDDGEPVRETVNVSALYEDDRLGTYEVWYSAYTLTSTLKRTGTVTKGTVAW